jgi:hypothetical protein
VKGMLVVIAFFADGMKTGGELGFRERRRLPSILGHVQSLNSIPS